MLNGAPTLAGASAGTLDAPPALGMTGVLWYF
jgi:hypothetical protein